MSDLISSSALLAELARNSIVKIIVIGEKSVWDIVKDQPTIEAVPVVRGKWEIVPGVMTPGGDPLLQCPICRSKESHHMGGIEFPEDWDYCPKCGAKLE
jgi:hypothetical protein